MGEVLGNLVDSLLERRDHLRFRWYRFRQRATPEWVIYSLVLSVALGLGVFVSIAATRGDSDVTLASAPGADLALLTDAVVTRTITRDGKVQRVVRYRTKRGEIVYATVSGPGSTVALPGRTLVETRTRFATRTITRMLTQTATQMVTVTQEPVTVTETVIVTVTQPPTP